MADVLKYILSLNENLSTKLRKIGINSGEALEALRDWRDNLRMSIDVCSLWVGV